MQGMGWWVWGKGGGGDAPAGGEWRDAGGESKQVLLITPRSSTSYVARFLFL
jgi:hypothetical protein